MVVDNDKPSSALVLLAGLDDVKIFFFTKDIILQSSTLIVLHNLSSLLALLTNAFLLVKFKLKD